ncbi:MAG: hypothetical protein HQ562_07010 [Candidatus Marinimicrobia bacterium]|nr:hypothetical protein [Candidatus Neomarinimicrobiota bacterium]
MKNINNVNPYHEDNPEIFNSAINYSRINGSTVIQESTCNQLIFNVMPNMGVKESLYIKEYRIGDNYIEATFNREYQSSMKNSPSHLIFLSVLVHMQKMLYVFMCHNQGLKYDPYGKEVLKVWPTSLDIQMPKLITQCNDIIHRIDIKKIRKIKEKIFSVTADTNINDIITINGMAMIYIL